MPTPTHADLWTRPRRGARGPRAKVTRTRVVRAAVRIADRGGLAAVSMEAVAARLGISAMALYRHVPGKAALVALMLDDGLGPPPKLAGSWRRRLVAWAQALAEVFRAHPWSLEASAGLRAMGPNELAWLNAGMAALEPTRLPLVDRHSACLAMLSIVRTFALFGRGGPAAEEAWEGAARVVVAQQPELVQVAALVDRPEARATLTAALAWTLDGLAARVARP